MSHFSAVTPQHREVGTGTQTTLSCVISGITQAVNVTWKKSGTEITSGDSFTANGGTYGSGTQTATLEISSAIGKELSKLIFMRRLKASCLCKGLE